MTLNNYENTISKSLVHSRTIFLEGYVREDGLFDIEGRIKDTKSYDVTRTDGSCLKKGDPLHEMHIVLTINIKMQIIPKFIQEREVFENIRRSVMDPSFPWFYSGTTASLYDKSDYLFYHWLYQDGNQMSDHFNPVLMPLLGRLNLNSLL